MNKTHEKALILATIIAGISLFVLAMLAQRTGLFVLQLLLPLAGISAALCVITWIRFFLLRNAFDEQLDEKALSENTNSMFETEGEDAAFSHARSRKQFERFAMPALCVIIALLELFWAFRLFKDRTLKIATQEDQLLSVAMLVGLAFVVFLISRYFLGLGRVNIYRMLIIPGVYLGLLALASLLVAVSILLAEAELTWPLTVMAWVLLGGIVLLAIEKLLFLVVGVYHPQRHIAMASAMQSRAGQLLVQPSAWAGRLVSTVDYQFGLDFSGSWFGRLFKSALIPMAAAAALIVYLSSAFVFVELDEVGVLERFGKPAENWRLESGLHIKMPWPVEQVQKVKAKKILSTYVGFEPKEGHKHPKIILWTVPHFDQEELLLIPSRSGEIDGGETPVALVTMHLPVEYQVTNVFKYIYNSADAEALITKISYQALTREMATSAMEEILGGDRIAAAEAIRQRIQAKAEEYNLGVEIVFAGLQGIHPPVAVAQAYESVMAAYEQKEAMLLGAEAYAAGLKPITEGVAAQIIFEAEAATQERIVTAESEARQFTKRLAAYKASPEVYKNNLYIDTITRAYAGVRKYLITDSDAKKIINIDFSASGNEDLLNFDFGNTAEESP